MCVCVVQGCVLLTVWIWCLTQCYRFSLFLCVSTNLLKMLCKIVALTYVVITGPVQIEPNVHTYVCTCAQALPSRGSRAHLSHNVCFLCHHNPCRCFGKLFLRTLSLMPPSWTSSCVGCRLKASPVLLLGLTQIHGHCSSQVMQWLPW